MIAIVDRRLFLAGAGASLLGSGAAKASILAPPGNRLAFSVLREGKEIGTHTLTFARNGDVWTIQVAIDLLIKLGPVPLYRYEHRATEIWNGASFASVEAQTNDDGARTTLRAQRGPDAVTVESSQQGKYDAPANALPSTHWNRRMLDGPFFNTQWGDLMSNAVPPRGAATVETASGRKIYVRRFEIVGQLTLESWYDDQQTWAGLQFKGQDGSQIVYKRQD
jgi:hypothetical protein